MLGELGGDRRLGGLGGGKALIQEYVHPTRRRLNIYTFTV